MGRLLMAVAIAVFAVSSWLGMSQPATAKDYSQPKQAQTQQKSQSYAQKDYLPSPSSRDDNARQAQSSQKTSQAKSYAQKDQSSQQDQHTYSGS